MFKAHSLIATSLLVVAAQDIAAAQSDLAAQHRQCERELDAAVEAQSAAFTRRDLDAFMAPFLDDAIQVNTQGKRSMAKRPLPSSTAPSWPATTRSPTGRS